MDIFKIVATGIVGAILSLTIRKYNPEISLLVAVITGVIIFLNISDVLMELMTILKGLAEKSGINSVYLLLVIKVTGIAYISEFGVQLCKDAGENAIATKIELAGKVLIMVVSAPVILAVLEMALNLIG